MAGWGYFLQKRSRRPWQLWKPDGLMVVISGLAKQRARKSASVSAAPRRLQSGKALCTMLHTGEIYCIIIYINFCNKISLNNCNLELKPRKNDTWWHNDNDKGIKLSRINWALIRGCSCICEWRCITSWIFDRYPVAPWRTATPRLSSQQHEQSWPPVPSNHSRLSHSRKNGGVLSFFPSQHEENGVGVALLHIMHWYNWVVWWWSCPDVCKIATWPWSTLTFAVHQASSP